MRPVLRTRLCPHEHHLLLLLPCGRLLLRRTSARGSSSLASAGRVCSSVPFFFVATRPAMEEVVAERDVCRFAAEQVRAPGGFGTLAVCRAVVVGAGCRAARSARVSRGVRSSQQLLLRVSGVSPSAACLGLRSFGLCGARAAAEATVRAVRLLPALLLSRTSALLLRPLPTLLLRLLLLLLVVVVVVAELAGAAGAAASGEVPTGLLADLCDRGSSNLARCLGVGLVGTR